MAIIDIHIHGDLNETKLNEIMASISELSAKVDALQAALDAEQQQIQDAIAALQETINELQTSGGTEAERQALADKLDAIKADLEGTVTPPAPEEPGEGA